MKGGGQEKVPEGRATRFEPPKISVGGIPDVTEDLRGNSSNCLLYSRRWRPKPGLRRMEAPGIGF